MVVLPFRPAVFRERSVADCPGEWGPPFDEIAVSDGGPRAGGDMIEHLVRAAEARGLRVESVSTL